MARAWTGLHVTSVGRYLPEPAIIVRNLLGIVVTQLGVVSQLGKVVFQLRVVSQLGAMSQLAEVTSCWKQVFL